MQYDPYGVRVARTQYGGDTVFLFAGGLPLAEYGGGAAATNPSIEYITLGNQLIAFRQGGTDIFFVRDHLSVRQVLADSSGTPTEEGHLPFGEAWYGSPTNNKWFFTSYKRDGTIGDDDAQARRYQYIWGRFDSPDPIMGNPADPQSWNRYTYVQNDPIDWTDPRGMQVMCPISICGGSAPGSGVDPTFSFGPSFNSVWSAAISGLLFNAVEYDFSGPEYFHWGDYGLDDLLRFADQGEISLDAVTPLGVAGFGGWGGNGAGGPPPFIPTLRLIPKSDSCGGGDRHIFYQVQKLNPNNTLGGMPSPPWYVTEYQTVWALAGPNGTTTNLRGNEFDDWISGAGQNPVNSIQTFTVAQSLNADATSYSIMVRIGGQDYGSLGIYTSNPPIVQGIPCPASPVH